MLANNHTLTRAKFGSHHKTLWKCLWREYELSLCASRLFPPSFSSLLLCFTLVCSVCVCVDSCKCVCGSYTAAVSACDLVWVSYRGHRGDVTVREVRQKKQMSSADGYPAVASSWDTRWSQMLWNMSSVLFQPASVIGWFGGEERDLNCWKDRALQKFAFDGNTTARVISHSQ